MSVSDIVNVQITRESTAVTQAGFSTVMILGTHNVFPERIRFYTDIDDMVTDGFLTTTPEYKAATAVFAQTPRPVNLAIGRRSVDSKVVTISTVDDSALYTITINNVAFTYQAVTSDTAAQIATGLTSAINGGAQPVTATAGATTVTLAADVADEYYSLVVDANMTISAYEPSATIAADLAAVDEASDDWYGLVITSRTPADVKAAAAWTEAKVKLFGTASDDEDILDSASTTDIGAELKAASYARTFLVYHTQATTVFPEAAWFGNQLAQEPGSQTWANKTLRGIETVKLTTTQRTNAFAKEVNTYESRGGVAITRNGTVSGNEYIDVIVGLDWLQARLTERLLSLVVNQGKIPFTDRGIAQVEAEVRAQLDQAVSRGVLADDTPYVVTVPKAADVSVNDRANRHLTGVKFTARLAGAIHTIEVRGTVTV